MKKTTAILSLLVVILSSCNFPGTQESGLTVEQQAATAVARTLTAVSAKDPLPTTSPTKDTGEQSQTTPTLSTEAPTIQPNTTTTALTGTSTATILTVDSNTNCREGPGTSYAIVIVLVPGTTYQMIARTTDNTYWVVTEIGKSTACWVPAEMSNAYGNVNQLSVTTPAAPTSSVGPVQAPTLSVWEYDCRAFPNIKVDMNWIDRSNNEIGFHLYRNGVLVVDLPANTTFYKDIFSGSLTEVYSYQVAAYNAAGEAIGGSISFSCQ